MVRRPHWLVGLLMGLMLPASVFQDTGLQHSPLSIAAASPAFFILMLVWFFRLSENPVDILLRARIQRLTVVVAVVLTYVVLNVYFALQFGLVAYGENLFVKGAKIGILFASLVYTGWLFSWYTIPDLSTWIRVGAFICFGGLILDYTIHDALVRSWWLHYGVNDERFGLIGFDDRPRGFSYESSTLGITLMVFGLLAALTARRDASRLASLVGTGVALIFCGSKAAFPIFFVSLICAVALTKWRWVLVVTFAAGPLVLLMAYTTMEQLLAVVDHNFLLPFILDIEETTSVATRLTMALSAILSVVEHPLGVGMTGYMPALVAKIESAGELGGQLLGFPLNLSEANTYRFQDTSFAIGAKSFLFDNALVFGVPFVVTWLGGHWVLLQRFRKAKDTLGLTLLVGMFIPLTFYVPGVSLYIVAIAYGYLIQRSRPQRVPHGVHS
jgi:hypothetical protein